MLNCSLSSIFNEYLDTRTMILTKNESFNLMYERKMLSARGDHRKLKFSKVPCIVYFSLLIVLCKVKYSENVKNEMKLNKRNSNWKSLNEAITAEKVPLRSTPLRTPPTNFAEVCLEPGGEPCIVSCIVKADDRQSVISWLEKQQTTCKTFMDVLFRESSFPADTFSKADLNGKFTLIILSLSLNALQTIDNNSFDKQSMHKVEKLIISQKGGNGIETMNEKTFYGLHTLKYFHMVNAKGVKELEANSMFKPLAKTLCELYFIQQFNENSKGYDPGNWLKGGDYVKLKIVNFRQNYFPNTLNANSFVTLNSVETLILTGCSINVLTPDTFTPIMKTLKQLDVSENKLKNLSPQLVLSFESVSEKIFLEENPWNCDCYNKRLIEAIKHNDINLADDPKCVTPTQWENTYMDEVDDLVNCGEETTQTTSGTSLGAEPTVEITEMSTTTFATTTVTEKIVNDVEINCFLNNNENKPMKIMLTNQLVSFELSSTSETSVQITFANKLLEVDLLYFTPNNIESRKYETINESVILINNLSEGANYVFCLIPNDDNELTSPFNCRAHRKAQHELNQTKIAWLTNSDKNVFITLITIALLICIAIGIFSVYCVLHCQYKKRHLSQNCALYQSSDNNNLNNYIKYFKRSEIAASNISTTNELENLSPDRRAPALPPLMASPRMSICSESSHIYDSVYQKDKDISINYLKPEQRAELATAKRSTDNNIKDSSPMEYAPEVPSAVLSKSNCHFIMDHFYQSLE